MKTMTEQRKKRLISDFLQTDANARALSIKAHEAQEKARAAEVERSAAQKKLIEAWKTTTNGSGCCSTRSGRASKA
jgi:hypothetical protein